VTGLGDSLEIVNKITNKMPTDTKKKQQVSNETVDGNSTKTHDTTIVACKTCLVTSEVTGDWIQCDLCEEWSHLRCVGLDIAPDHETKWYCSNCLMVMDSNNKLTIPYVPLGSQAEPPASTSKQKVQNIVEFPEQNNDLEEELKLLDEILNLKERKYELLLQRKANRLSGAAVSGGPMRNLMKFKQFIEILSN
jgi:hypothetical protein